MTRHDLALLIDAARKRLAALHHDDRDAAEGIALSAAIAAAERETAGISVEDIGFTPPP